MDKLEVIETVRDGCWAVARNRARNRHQAEDFMSEAMLAALEVIERYPDKKEQELINLIGRSAINRITQAQRKEITVGKYNVGPVDDERDASPDNFERDIEHRDFVRVLMSRLSAVQRRILKEKLRPSKTTLRAIDARKQEKAAARLEGRLVMNVDSDEVTTAHIAKIVGASKATVCRQFGGIKQKAAELLGE